MPEKFPLNRTTFIYVYSIVIYYRDGEEEIEGDNIVPGTLVVSSQIGDIKVPSVPENFTDKVIIEFNVKVYVLVIPQR